MPNLTRVCCWCDPSHILEAGDDGAGISHSMCPQAEAREWAKMPLVVIDASRAQDIAVSLIGGLDVWRAAANVERIAMLLLAERALVEARHILGRA